MSIGDKCPVCGKPGPYVVYSPMEGCYHPDLHCDKEKKEGK